jgi:colanic acid/amylovoran biosynthesis protein
MRILIENGCYSMRNLGDIAMLQVAVKRLQKFWPGALIEVLTSAPNMLIHYCPDAHPVSSRGRTIWCKTQNLFGSIQNVVPARAYNLLMSLHKMKCRMIRNKDLSNFLTSLHQADLVIASGGGYLTDTFEKDAIRVLNVIGLAAQSGKPTAMFGQGIGPIKSRKLLSKAGTTLPLLDLIALREKRAGLPILELLGVASDNVMTTGDDSIELAYEARAAGLGTGLGVNLRVAAYSRVQEHHIKILRLVLRDAAGKHGVSLVPVPILFRSKEPDNRIIRYLLSGNNDASECCQTLEDPIKAVEKIGLCRIVVTGSYHGAVFALAQGIPIVGLAHSAYYMDKFLGLADQFGSGCEVICLDDENLREKLAGSIDTAYTSAEQLKPQLLKAAERQIALSRLAYQRIYELAESRNAKR